MSSIKVPEPPCGGESCEAVLHQLATAIEHRDAIGMAKGLVMAATDCDPDHAFGILCAESQDRNLKLWQVAERHVDAHRARVQGTRLASSFVTPDRGDPRAGPRDSGRAARVAFPVPRVEQPDLGRG